MTWGTDSRKRTSSAKWKKIRLRVLLRDSFICYVCGNTGADQVDHITAASRGGSDDESNLKAICGHCHRRKSAQEGARASNKFGAKMEREKHPGLR